MKPNVLQAGNRTQNQMQKQKNKSQFNYDSFAQKHTPKAEKLIRQEKECSENIWIQKLESQNLTDPNFFLNRYSYNSPVSNFVKNKSPQIKKQNVRPIAVLSGKTLQNKPLYIMQSIPANDSFLINANTKSEDDYKGYSLSNADKIDDLMSYADSENIESLFDEFEKASLVSQFTCRTSISQATKKSQRTTDSRNTTFSCTSPLISSPKKTMPFTLPVHKYSRSAFFQPFPNRPIRTTFDDSIKHDRERSVLTGTSLSPQDQAKYELNHSTFTTPNSKHNVVPYFLPDSRIPTRKEVNRIFNDMNKRNRPQGDVQIPLFQKSDDRIDLQHAVKTLSTTAAFFEMAGMT